MGSGIRPFLRLLALSCALAPGLAVADDAGEVAGDKARRTGEIVVIGTGLDAPPAAPAYAPRTIDREEIATSPSGRLEDVLGAIAGFQQFRRSDSRSANPSAQGVTLRALGGNATSRALVLLDGVPMADPFFGYVPFSALPPERLQRAVVTRGGGVGPFGAGALAGTIELESAGRDALGPLSGALFVNTRGETEASASIAPALGGGFALLSGRWDRGQGFYTAPRSQRVPASVRAGYDSWSLGARAVFPLGDALEVQGRVLAFDDRRTLRFAGADSSSSGLDASLRLVARGEWQFDALAYAQWRDFSNVVVSSTRFVPVLDQRKTPSTGLGGKIELRPPVGQGHVLRIGADYRRASGTMFEDAYSAFTGALRESRSAGGHNGDLGIYVEHDWSVGPVELTGGVRADRTTVRGGRYIVRDPAGAVVETTRFDGRADWYASWRAAALWQAAPGIALRGAVYQGIRLPTLNELYRPFVVFPVTTLANADLANERLQGYEAGLVVRPADGVTLSATGFRNRVKGAIANVTIGEELRQRQNLPAIEAYGLELDAGIVRGPFRFDGSLSWVHAEVVGRGASAALDGKRPAQSPRLMLGGTVSWTPAPGWMLAASLRHVGRQYEDDLESDVLPPATTLGAVVEMPLGGSLALVVRGENLLGERIVTRNSGGDLDLGVPRTVWFGLRVAP